MSTEELKPETESLANRFATTATWDDQCGSVLCKLGVVTVAERDEIVAALRIPAQCVNEPLDSLVDRLHRIADDLRSHSSDGIVDPGTETFAANIIDGILKDFTRSAPLPPHDSASAALQPFAKWADAFEAIYGASRPDDVQMAADGKITITLGDLRHARAALASHSQEVKASADTCPQCGAQLGEGHEHTLHCPQRERAKR